jgi:hypothetical protein
MSRKPLSRPRSARFRRWAAVLVFAVCGAAAAGAAEETTTLYQWTDSSGAYRYTPIFDRIPGYARESAVMIQPGAEPPPQTPVYFEPDPRAAVVAVPAEPAEPAGAASAGGAAVPQASVGGWVGEYDVRIRELEDEIAEHEEALKQLISAPGTDADVEVSPELREIARRLPRLQAELASLRRGRASASSAP